MLSTSLLMAASMVGGQAEESVDPNLKQLEPLVGTWQVTFDWPEIPFKEAKVTYKWVLDGKYLKANWSDKDGNDLGPEMFTWDPFKKTIRMWGFDSESFYEATWRIDGNKLIGEYRGKKFTKAKTKDTVTMELEGKSSISAGNGGNGTAKFKRIEPK